MSEFNGKNIWKSLREYQNDPELLKEKISEFKEGVTDEFDTKNMNSFSRRKFLAILAASSAYAATACTDYRDKGEIVPYVDRPENVLPGKPNYYASTFVDNGEAHSILVKTREGRPIKIEGNDADPISAGKVSSRGQASILNLYDPERLKDPTLEGKKITWSKVDTDLISKLTKYSNEGKEIAFVTNPVTSPTTKKVISQFKKKYPTTKTYTIKLINNENRKLAWNKSFSSDLLPLIRWDKAKVIVALESDFLGKEGNNIENVKLYTKSRDIVNGESISRLYAFEAGMTLTGMNADIRFRLKPQQQHNLVLSILNKLLEKGKLPENLLTGETLTQIKKNNLSKFAADNGLNDKKLEILVKDLIDNKGKAVVYAGDYLPVETHLAVNLLNEVLGASSLYDYSLGFVNNGNLTSVDEINDLIKNMNNGNVGAVIHFDSNPVYELASNLGYADALKNVETTITLSEVNNETTKLTKYILPLNDNLESWGDYLVRNGNLNLQQPVISELFDTRQKETILLSWLNNGKVDKDTYHKYLMNSFKEDVYSKGNFASDFKTFWFTALHDGAVKTSNKKISHPKLNKVDFALANKVGSGFTLILQDNYFIGHGQYANNGWLQELPHPVSKVTWDNYAAIAPKTAEQLKISDNDVLKINVDGREVSIAALIQPGMTENTLVIELGYGRDNAGTVADGVGTNVNLLLDGNNPNKFVFDNVSVSKTGTTYKLVSTQEHHSLNDEFVKDLHLKRHIIQEGTLEEYSKNPKFLEENKAEVFSITNNYEYKDVKWAMTIDLNKCLGCSECITSCNVENNVPVVGKDQVEVGREMQWLRIDRYYSGTPEEPIVSTQPMLCSHCDNAPCENVCPVNATNHSPDGLNQMVYNRCVGTRYCANNCPYKVRRFNFFNFRDHFRDQYYQNDLTELVNNPEVTVRSRGVIEKCTFCVQNIMEAREDAIREGKEFDGSGVTTSCQSACPANAIEFGNSNDSEAIVSKHREHNLSYHVLEELGIIPNVTYLAKIRNTHSEDV